VLVIASGLDRRVLPPWGPTQGLATFGELARMSSAFSAYRAPSNVASASVGSLITGLPPGVHGLEDPAARLPAQARTLGALVKEASGRTAFFTGVPTTFRAFGFDTGWDRYETFSPVSDIEASAPIARATQWFEDEEFAENDGKRRLVVIHARGGHPPWDVSKDEAAHLPPDEYSGLIDARRGGVVLGRLRAQRGKPHKKLGDDDWARLRALIGTALVKQDVALGQLIAVLKKKGVWDSALFVVVTDVSPGDAPDVPFDPAGSLGEDRLLAPLLVKFPGQKLGGKDVTTPVTSVDVAATILTMLGLKVPADLPGIDLYSVADGRAPLAGRGLCATLGDRYSTRLGPWLLSGQVGKVPTLCQLDVDPACVNDAFAQKPIAGTAAWQWTFSAFELANKKRVAAREPASIDPDTGAALTVWGDI